MRRDLFFAFLFVIVCVAGITGLISNRIASDEFERLVINNTDQTLSSIAFTAQDIIRIFPTWDVWQESFNTQYAEVQAFLSGYDQQDTLNRQIIISATMSSINTILFTEEELSDLPQVLLPLPDGEIISDFIPSGEDYTRNIIFSLLLELEINNQQLLIVEDERGMVMVDSHNIYLNQPLPDLNNFPYATILGEDERPIARLYIILQSHFYSEAQLTFLANIQKGNLIGIVVGILIALIIALIFAQKIIHPMQSLNDAMLEVKRGNWGHQVANMGRHEIYESLSCDNFIFFHLC